MKERSRARMNRSNKNKKKSLRSQLINSKLNVFLNQKVKRNELIFIDLILNFVSINNIFKLNIFFCIFKIIFLFI